MGIISMIIVGFIVGLLARAIMPGDQKLCIIMTIILGIVGAVVAGYLGGALGLDQPGEGAGWIGSIFGAIIVLFIYGLIAINTSSALSTIGQAHNTNAQITHRNKIFPNPNT